MCSVSIESPIESLKVSPRILTLTHQVVEYRIDLTKGTFTLWRLELVHLNFELSRELPYHDLLLKIFKNTHVRPFLKISPNCLTVLILCN